MKIRKSNAINFGRGRSSLPARIGEKPIININSDQYRINLTEIRAFARRAGTSPAPTVVKTVLGLIGTVILILAVTVPVFAQGGANITGRIMDENGSSVVGAEVRLRSRSGLMLFARSDANGAYGFSGLGSGDYLLEVTARGFATNTSEEFRVERGQSVTRDIQLRVKSVNESVVVVAAGTPQRVDEVSKAVTLLDEREMEARRELTLTESLRGVPGARVQQRGSYGALTSVRLRGLRNQDTAVLLDGLRVRDASDINGSALPFTVDLLPVALDRIEILRGSGSSIYGTNAIGGVLNLIPKTGAGQARFEASLEGGQFHLFRERLQGSGGIGSRAGFSFGLSRLDVRRGLDGEDQYGNTAGGARFQFNPTSSITIGANFYGTISNARINDSPFALTGAFNTGELYPAARVGVTFQPDFNNPDQGRRNRLLTGSLRLNQVVNETVSYGVAYQRVSSRRRNYNGPAIDPRFAAFYPFGDFEFTSVNVGLTDTFDARSNLRLGRANLMTLGFEFESERSSPQFITAFTPARDPTNNVTDRQRTYAFFGQDQIFLLNSHLQISLGARGQWFRIRAADRPGFLSGIKAESSITGDGSIAYFIRSTATKFRAHVGNGFRAPSLFERFGQGIFGNAGQVRFGDPTLRAEHSISADGGFDQSLKNERVRFGATYFYTRLQRVIEFTNFTVDPLGLGRLSGYTNRPGGLARGVESYFESAPLRGMEVRASYTFTNSDRFEPSAGLTREFIIPKHLIAFNITERYRSFLINFDLNRTGSYITRIFESSLPFRPAVLRFSGYTKADLYLSYERSFSDRLTMLLFGGADNIFDEGYFEDGFRAPGVAGRGGVSFRF